MISPVNLLNQNAAAGPSAPSTSSATNPVPQMASEQTFLQLLVTQIKNQNPLSPTDSIQFVTQLAQFSQVEATVGVKKDADAILKTLQQQAAAATPATTPTQS